MRVALLALLSAVIFTTSCRAWGPIGHWTIAAVAQSFLSPDAQAAILHYLPETNGQLPPIASWADEVRATIYPWNRPFHGAFTLYNAKQYNFMSDCWANRTISSWMAACNDGATQNYSARLNNVNVNYTERVEALKYITHFAGDISQPLHGGFFEDYSADQVRGTWFGNQTTLHTVWDRSLIDMRVNRDFNGNWTSWTDYMVRHAPSFSTKFPGWLSCEGSVNANLFRACSDLWTTEANQLCMPHVYRYNATGPQFNASTGFTITQETGYYEFNIG